MNELVQEEDQQIYLGDLSGEDILSIMLDENNQILDTHAFGQGYIPESAFTYDAFTGGPIMVTVQNEDGSFSQDGYLKIVR